VSVVAEMKKRIMSDDGNGDILWVEELFWFDENLKKIK
jgi:hypothetical protein